MQMTNANKDMEIGITTSEVEAKFKVFNEIKAGELDNLCPGILKELTYEITGLVAGFLIIMLQQCRQSGM